MRDKAQPEPARPFVFIFGAEILQQTIARIERLKLETSILEHSSVHSKSRGVVIVTRPVKRPCKRYMTIPTMRQHWTSPSSRGWTNRAEHSFAS